MYYMKIPQIPNDFSQIERKIERLQSKTGFSLLEFAIFGWVVYSVEKILQKKNTK